MENMNPYRAAELQDALDRAERLSQSAEICEHMFGVSGDHLLSEAAALRASVAAEYASCRVGWWRWLVGHAHTQPSRFLHAGQHRTSLRYPGRGPPLPRHRRINKK